jgi:hypothetical protein
MILYYYIRVDGANSIRKEKMENNRINRYEIYIVWTTTMNFTRVGDSDLFEVVGEVSHVLVKEEDLKKLQVGEPFEIPIFYGVRWNRKGQRRMTEKTYICRLPDDIIGSITTYTE